MEITNINLRMVGNEPVDAKVSYSVRIDSDNIYETASGYIILTIEEYESRKIPELPALIQQKREAALNGNAE